MIGFREAVIYGKYIFGRKFKEAIESDDGGWVGFLLKGEGDVVFEDQTWDEFESTWNHMLKVDKKLVEFVKNYGKSQKKKKMKR